MGICGGFGDRERDEKNHGYNEERGYMDKDWDLAIFVVVASVGK